MKIRPFFPAVILAVLTGCGSASDAVTFQPPPSFHAKASFGPFMQLWESQPHNVIMLMSFPAQADLNKAMDQANLKDAQVKKNEHVKICDGSQDAVFAELEAEERNSNENAPLSGPAEVEFLATNVKGKTYMAMYSRPLHSAADPAAEAAIRNICPK